MKKRRRKFVDVYWGAEDIKARENEPKAPMQIYMGAILHGYPDNPYPSPRELGRMLWKRLLSILLLSAILIAGLHILNMLGVEF